MKKEKNIKKLLLLFMGILILTSFLSCQAEKSLSYKKHNHEPKTTISSSTNKIDEGVNKVKEASEEVKKNWENSDIKKEVETSNTFSEIKKFFGFKDAPKKEQSVDDEGLATLDYNGQKSIPVNNGKSTLTWNWDTNKIIYSNLDNLNRAGKATAYLSKLNYGKSAGREGQTWKPTGWLNNQQKNKDRGHLIAYTLSFNFDNDGNYSDGQLGSIDNPKNLFTQTSQSNRGIMQDYEEIVREALKQDKKVIYEVTPIFRDDELMARGVHVQAISEDGTVNFNQYLFNIDDKYDFDYQTGKSTKK